MKFLDEAGVGYLWGKVKEQAALETAAREGEYAALRAEIGNVSEALDLISGESGSISALLDRINGEVI